jgi:hypothetical protein
MLCHLLHTSHYGVRRGYQFGNSAELTEDFVCKSVKFTLDDDEFGLYSEHVF